jgi:hypothetical protein
LPAIKTAQVNLVDYPMKKREIFGMKRKNFITHYDVKYWLGNPEEGEFKPERDFSGYARRAQK